MAYYQIKQASQRVGVSIRTLQYYDSIALVTPSKRSDKGFRLYSEQDITQLQLISTLKYCGYNLQQIKSFLNENQFNLMESLTLQNHVIEEKIKHLTQAKRLTSQLKQQLHQQHTIDWSVMAKITQIFQQNNADLKQDLALLLNTKEMQELRNTHQHNLQGNMAEYQQKWKALYQKVEKNLNLDPHCAQSQALLKEWMTLVNQMYGPNQALQYKVWQALQAGAISTEQNHPKEQAIFDFIAKVQAASEDKTP